MAAIRFCLAAVALASAGVGCLRAARSLLANDWLAYGDAWLFWERWSGDVGAKRLILAAALAAGIALLAHSRLLSERVRPLFERVVRIGGSDALLIPSLILFLLPHTVTFVLRPDPAGKPSVLFVMLDTVRLDYTGWGSEAMGRGPGLPESPTPRLDALAHQGIAFTQAISNTNWTKPSVGTMLTGLMPSRHLAVGRPGRGYFPNLEARNRTLAEAFAAAGYDTGAVSTNPNVSRRYGFDQGFHMHHDEALSAEQVIAKARPWIEARKRPFFLYLHFNDAHYPYEPPEGYRGLFDETESAAQLTGPLEREYREGRLQYSEEDLEHLRMAYAEEIRYLDDQVGAFVESMVDSHPNLLVVIVSDHGEEFEEHGDLGHGQSLYEEQLRVPLQIVWGERLAEFPYDLEPARIDVQVGLSELAPTLLELVGLPWPEDAPGPDGESLVAWWKGVEPPVDLPVFSETDADGSPRSGLNGPLRAWREPGAKVVRTIKHPERDGEPLLIWLFDLQSDPGETRNVYEEQLSFAESLLRQLAASGWLVDKPPAPLVPPDLGDLPQATRSELEEMGYVDSGQPLDRQALELLRSSKAPRGQPHQPQPPSSPRSGR